jgi:hypothetical protein
MAARQVAQFGSAVVAEKRSKSVKVTAILGIELHAKLSAAAALPGITKNAILVDALTEALKGIVAFDLGRVTTRSSASRSAPVESATLTLPAKKRPDGAGRPDRADDNGCYWFQVVGQGGRVAATLEDAWSIPRLA